MQPPGWKTVLALACLAAAAPFLHGQSTFGTILSTVSDQQGKTMPAVEVTLTEQNTNITRTSSSNQEGNYEFLNLNPGVYRVCAGRSGSKIFLKADIELSARQTARPDRIGNGHDGPRLTGSSGLQWFNINAFSDPAANLLGNSARNIPEGPGFRHTSASLTKKVRFRESAELWLSVVAMDAINHPNFGSTSTLLSTDRAADRAKSRNVWLCAHHLLTRPARYLCKIRLDACS
jgi:hypothetical protein